MVVIECPLCAESIDLGMAEEGEYECPYCEDVFHWKPEESRDIENHQCPKGCGRLSRVVNAKGEIRYYECRKCKGSLLNSKNIGTILKDKSDKVGTLESLLEKGVPCDLDCPTCEGKMVKIKVYYKPPRRYASYASGRNAHDAWGRRMPKSLPELALMLVIAAPIAAYEMSKHGFLDGCGDCGSFWFDKGEIDKIRKADEVDGMGI